jgi:DNA-directed RNA polymerase specialized sigma24 family protein
MRNRTSFVSDFVFRRDLKGMHPAMNSRDPRSALLADAAILASLRKAIAAIVPAQEVEDIAQATLLEAWQAEDSPLERDALGRWLALKGRMNAIDFLRKSGRRKRWHGKDDVEVDDLPAARAEAAHDARDGLRFAQAKLDARAGTGTSVRWLLLRLQGESFAAIAQAEGTSEEAVTKSVRRVRAQLRAAWVAVAAIAVFWILRALFGRNPQEERAHHDTVSSAAPPQAPALSSSADEAPTPEQHARELRQRALRECDAKQWAPCLQDLQSASDYDPAGDSDPQVKRAKDEAKRHLPDKPPM